jgi:hypothetical protein
MPRQLAEVIDLKAYREQRSAASRVRGSQSGRPSTAGAVSPATFVMPTAFFFFWPSWVLAPAFPIDSAATGHSLI